MRVYVWLENTITKTIYLILPRIGNSLIFFKALRTVCAVKVIGFPYPLLQSKWIYVNFSTVSSNLPLCIL